MPTIGARSLPLSPAPAAPDADAMSADTTTSANRLLRRAKPHRLHHAVTPSMFDLPFLSCTGRARARLLRNPEDVNGSAIQDRHGAPSKLDD
jgi:hypothetical protein